MTVATATRLLVRHGQGRRRQDDASRRRSALLAAERGRRTIVVELGAQARLPALFGVPAAEPGAETELDRAACASVSIDPDRALLEWLQALGGRVSGRRPGSGSGTFQYFAAAAPGAKERQRWSRSGSSPQDGAGAARRGYDRSCVDAPATGHALGMLRSPRRSAAIARVGPIAGPGRRRP